MYKRQLVYYGLYALQHRGQESAGIVVNDDGIFRSYKDVGLVNEVFNAQRLNELGLGNIAIGHVRYGTTGTDKRLNAQPIVVNHIKGRIALAHNGNLTNSYELREALEMAGSIFHTTSDTEVISYLITKERLTSPSIEAAVNLAMHHLQGCLLSTSQSGPLSCLLFQTTEEWAAKAHPSLYAKRRMGIRPSGRLRFFICLCSIPQAAVSMAT